jgi:alkylation response protein AidB-like acyl-CoA dehydrogenase
MTDLQRDVVGRVRELGPAMSDRAERYDREASFPYENFADLADAGLLRLCIPSANGGLGADFTTYSLVAEELGRYCGSTALAFNMHTATTLLAGQISDELGLSDDDHRFVVERRTRMWADIVENGTVHAQPFSEGLDPRATKGFATVAEPTDGGYLVTGRKIFASLSTSADIHNVACMVEGDDRIRLLGVPAGADGLTITGDWDPLGMRGTVSKTLELDRVFVPAENEWVPPGMFNQMATRWPHFYMTLSFAFVGVMGAVVDFTGRYLSGEIDGTSRAGNPQKEYVWGDMQVRYEQARALARRAADEAGADPSPAALRRAWSSVVATMEGAPAVASAAVQACGGRSLLRPLPLERLYRDARCGATMLPWSAEICRERLGSLRGGIDGIAGLDELAAGSFDQAVDGGEER